MSIKYECPICGGNKFRDNSANYMAIVNERKSFVFEHSCLNNGCEGILLVACDTSFENRRVIYESDINSIIKPTRNNNQVAVDQED